MHISAESCDALARGRNDVFGGICTSVGVSVVIVGIDKNEKNVKTAFTENFRSNV